ncbi:MAG: uL15m family ribosomal protein [Candidatus Hodarchaeales archaeon]|jgi:large subunit ribosomal protein L15
MTIRKRKKVRRQRGSRTYGYGRISGGHRKGGSRGGKGNAGIKDHHQIGRVADMIHNKRGFTVPNNNSSDLSINIGEIDEQIDLLLTKKIASKEGSAIKLDISKLGFSKVLGKGLINHSLHLSAKNITSRAKEKIEAAGGKVFTNSNKNI